MVPRGYDAAGARKIALTAFPNQCSVCRIDEPLEVHHIDGNPANNDLSNLLLFCPTCHQRVTSGIWKVDPMNKGVFYDDFPVGLFEQPEGAGRPPALVVTRLEDFWSRVDTLEKRVGKPLLLLHDPKTDVFYTTCHISARTAAELFDFEASLDPEEQEEYRANREIFVNHPAYLKMQADAAGGRQFEDIVIEYNVDYRDDLPLKIIGGQHRAKCIESVKDSHGERYHGFRVYFALNKEQRVEINRISNTSIAISNDLLDRMQETLLGPFLRDWCQKTELLAEQMDFADRRTAEGMISVRLARTFVVNFFRGRYFSQDVAVAVHEPYICKSGDKVDPIYYKTVNEVKDLWDDSALLKAGLKFADLVRRQRTTCEGDKELRKLAEYRNKAMTPAVLASWAYVAGILQVNPQSLDLHYGLPDRYQDSPDPLNVRELTKARHASDPETYRGLGTRTDRKDLGRLVEVFLLHAEPRHGRGLTKELIRAGIAKYHERIAKAEAETALKRAEEAAEKRLRK